MPTARSVSPGSRSNHPDDPPENFETGRAYGYSKRLEGPAVEGAPIVWCFHLPGGHDRGQDLPSLARDHGARADGGRAPGDPLASAPGVGRGSRAVGRGALAGVPCGARRSCSWTASNEVVRPVTIPSRDHTRHPVARGLLLRDMIDDEARAECPLLGPARGGPAPRRRGGRCLARRWKSSPSLGTLKTPESLRGACRRIRRRTTVSTACESDLPP